MKEKHRHPQFSTKGLVAHYKLWAGLTSTAKVFDYSLNGFTGVPTGTDIAPAYPGFKFNGTNDFIDLSSSFQSVFRSSYTISAWAKLTDGQDGGNQTVCGTENALAEDRVQIRVDPVGQVLAIMESNNIVAIAQSPGVVFVNGPTPWVHLVMTAVEDTSINLYVDGEFQDTTSAVALTFADWTSSDNLYLGANNVNGASASRLAGKLGESMLFGRALTPAEVKSVYELTKWRYPNN